VPVVLIFSLVFGRWRWCRSRSLWLGLLPALLLVIPWHLLQHWRYGGAFWNEYLGHELLQRVLTGSSVLDRQQLDPTYYLQGLWLFYQPWVMGLALGMGYTLWAWRRYQTELHLAGAAFFSALSILVAFMTARSQLFPYLFPMYPFAAMGISAALWHGMSRTRVSPRNATVAVALVVTLGGLIAIPAAGRLQGLTIRPEHSERRAVGQRLRSHNTNHAPLYALLVRDTVAVEFYSGQPRRQINGSELLSPPFYLLTPPNTVQGFFDAHGQLLPDFNQLEVLYRGESLLLLYSTQELKLVPPFEGI